MKNEKAAIDDFLDELNEQKQEPFKTDETALEGEKDETAVEEEPEEKPLPFNKDPKVQRYIDKKVKKALEDAKPTEAARFREETREEADEVSGVLERIIGNDTPEKLQAVKDFRKVLNGLEEKGAKRALAEFQEQANAAAAKDQAAQEELDESFEEIEDTYNVDLSSNTSQSKKLRSDFLDYVRKVAPKDRKTGEVIAFPDMNSTFEEFQERQKRIDPTASRRKELASRGMTRSSDASASQPTGDRSWKTVDKLISKLSN